MAPIILHRALSFSNVPIHRRDVSPFKEASAASNRHEGLALLTTIAEDTSFCNPSPLLPNHLALEKRLISKILLLREALDLPCRSPCNVLDQLLLDTLDALKITYPKCLSGLSGNHTSSVQQGLVHLRKVLMSVQDCHAEHSEMNSLGSEKQTVIESESLDHVGELVAAMLDQVIPKAKGIFSFMESSKSANAAAAAVWPEDLHLPERRSLPPVLCHRKSGGHQPSYSAEAATPCQDGTMRHTEELKVQEPAPRREADEGSSTGEDSQRQTSSRGSPSTPTGDCLLLQTTPSSVSPHPLSAPPPSPVPLLGMPMLLQSWEAMQDDSASPAAVSPTDAHPAEEAAPTARQVTADVRGNNDGSSISASMEAGQPSSPSSMDGNAAVPTVPPSPLATHRDRVQEGTSRDKPVEAVAISASPPPPAASLEQGGPPAKVTRAPPPPPLGNISAALRARKTAGKLKRSAQMGTLYRHLRDRVEGSACPHRGRRQTGGKKPRTPGGPKSEAGQGMADALAEMTKRSAYFRQIEEDAENHAAAILELKDAIGSFQSSDMAELVRFHQHVEQQLVRLTDETQVLARFEGFPSKKLESLRMAAALHSKLDGAVSKLKGWNLLGAPVSKQLDRVEAYFNKIKDDVDVIERNKDEEAKRFQSHGIHLDLGVLVRIKECMVDLSSSSIELALKESHHHHQEEEEDANTKEKKTATIHRAAQSPAAGVSRMLWRVFQLAFRVYNFAGGQDERADKLTSALAHEIEAHPL